MECNEVNAIVVAAKSLVCEAEDVLYSSSRYYMMCEREVMHDYVRRLPTWEFFDYLERSCEEMKGHLWDWDNRVDVYRAEWCPMPPVCEYQPHSVESAYKLRRTYDLYLHAKRMCDVIPQRYRMSPNNVWHTPEVIRMLTGEGKL